MDLLIQVKWDKDSVFVRGERVMLYSGEFHPFRLPVPGLWLDIFQKIKALGFNGVSFYTDWGLLEGNPGRVVVDGVWALDEFFDAASEAGIYLIARPGPYINAETAAGGIPGWVLRINGTIRSMSQDYLDATKNYVSTIGQIIARAQITNGGPVILLQPENEYSTWPGENDTTFPNDMNRLYMAFVERQFRDTGIVVPYVVNDNKNLGYFAPGSGEGAVDIYGIDSYPLRYDCANPYIWPTYRWPTGWQIDHQKYSPTTPFTIGEFQGGSGGGWGGVTEEGCAILVNNEAVRVVYKNNYSFGVKVFNVYMTYGGTNWGNLGYEGGYTSYDYGAAITEGRHVRREKYSETKLEAIFLKSSPAYLTAIPGNETNGSYASTSAIGVTPLFGAENNTNFYIVRHADFTSTSNTTYKLSVPTSIGNVTIPQLGGALSINGRDSKIHVTDYDVGGLNLIYSTADIYTWTKGPGVERVLIIYGGAAETHEFAVPVPLGRPDIIEGAFLTTKQVGAAWIVQWKVTPQRKVVQFGDGRLEVHLLWRNEAYNYWALELPAAEPIGNYTSPSKSSVIVQTGYLLRTAQIVDDELRLTGDINSTTNIEIISAPTEKISLLKFNGQIIQTTKSPQGRIAGSVPFSAPNITLPSLSALEWKYFDSLPEIKPDYDDSLWIVCDHLNTTNPLKPSTPTSLYATDYGFHSGSLIYRGHFVSNGLETSFSANISGGYGFGYSIWLNSTFLGSFTGTNAPSFRIQTLPFPTPLTKNSHYILTILIDHMGQDEEAPGTDAIKSPFGILSYNLTAHPATDLTWKLTGNLGGEQYLDLIRGPRNEGAMAAERHGYHLPNAPDTNWPVSNPITHGLERDGVGFYATHFDLHIPLGYDVPLNFVFSNTTASKSNYRIQLFVNGFQYGKYSAIQPGPSNNVSRSRRNPQLQWK
ncbi:putative beta-galactosidase e [Phaeomoniella chlamydospora]|uniref:Beta-galactosidase n=1 Tax=Phaeomoniella chlamydospora TaxID=158046 RepID=A0A0G2E0K0_PHACM|nr:putative beta-galactosidase e [Phaeomoniella chlamydospora]